MSIVDIYGSLYAEKIFKLENNIGKIYDGELIPNSDEWKEYDLVIDYVYIPRVERYKREKISRIDSELSRMIDIFVGNNLYEETNRISPDVSLSVLWRLILERSRLLGFNRYSVMGANGFFDINDKKVLIQLDESYRKKYEGLGLRQPFITVNYGIDKTSNGKPQIKMWPKAFHEKLNTMIKERYPKITIIQLGSANACNLKGIDRYILGEDLDVVKYILRDSICHIDCEGGLVHLASQIGTKCFVMFGPTPMWFYGYEQNCNIKSDVCGECYCLTNDWMTECIKYDRPECMYAIKPKVVFEKIEEFFNEEGFDFRYN